MSKNQIDTNRDSDVDEAIKMPSLYNVYIINDHFTPQDFVVFLLENYFSKTSDEAEKLMLKVHNEGEAVAGTYTKEIAEAKSEMVRIKAKEHNFPLRAKVSKVKNDV